MQFLIRFGPISYKINNLIRMNISCKMNMYTYILIVLARLLSIYMLELV